MSDQPPEELLNDALLLLQRVVESGKIKKGTNEVTKSLRERKCQNGFSRR